jgi:hypothetical protein
MSKRNTLERVSATTLTMVLLLFSTNCLASTIFEITGSNYSYFDYGTHGYTSNTTGHSGFGRNHLPFGESCGIVLPTIMLGARRNELLRYNYL